MTYKDTGLTWPGNGPQGQSRKMKYLCILFLLVFAPLQGETAEALVSDAAAKRVNELFSEWDVPGSPGCAVSVSIDGKTAIARGYGSANLDYGIPITADTVFHVASVSKQFTAAAIALLVNEGRLSLDDDIRDYVPELPDFGEQITIRHLVHHTSGIRDQWELLELNGWRYSHDLITNDDVFRVLSRQKSLNFSPGEKHLYSNSGYTILARIVARVSGKRFREYVEENLFEPLGMQSSFFRDNFQELVNDQATGYVQVGAGFEQSVTNFETVGATSLMTTVNDLSKWAHNFTTGKVGGATFLQQMSAKGRLADGSDVDYAFALIPGTYRGLDVIEHSGSDAGYTAHLMLFPEQRISVATLCNLPNDTSGLSREVADIFIEDLAEPGSTPYQRHKLPAEPVAIPADLQRSRVGLYREAESGDFLDIVRGDDGLTVHNWSMELPLHPITQNLLRVGPYAVYIDFVADKDGEPAIELTWGNAAPTLYKRVRSIALSEAASADYIGSYSSDEIAVLYTIARAEDGTLRLGWSRHYGTLLRPATQDTFFSNMAGTLEFRRDAHGEITGFDLTGSRSRAISFRKVAPVAGSSIANTYRPEIGAASRLIIDLIHDESIPGLSVAVAANGEIVWAEGFGFADLEHNISVQRETKFRIGSISKSLTATALGLLVDDGALDLDVPLSSISEKFAGKGDAISVRQLAAHRSGLPHYTGDDFDQSEHYETMTDAMQKYWHKEMLFEPGSEFAYSSFGYNLLGAVIEQVSGNTFVDFIDEHIGRELGLDSIVPDALAQTVPYRTAFYHRGPDGELRIAPAVDNSDLWAGGGYLANAADLALFGNAVINGSFLNPQTRAELLAPANEDDGPGAGFGLGWITGELNGVRHIGHTGSHYGCMANLRVYPDAHIAIVTFANLSSEASEPDGQVTNFYTLADNIATLFMDHQGSK